MPTMTMLTLCLLTKSSVHAALILGSSSSRIMFYCPFETPKWKLVQDLSILVDKLLTIVISDDVLGHSLFMLKFPKGQALGHHCFKLFHHLFPS